MILLCCAAACLAGWLAQHKLLFFHRGRQSSFRNIIKSLRTRKGCEKELSEFSGRWSWGWLSLPIRFEHITSTFTRIRGKRRRGKRSMRTWQQQRVAIHCVVAKKKKKMKSGIRESSQQWNDSVLSAWVAKCFESFQRSLRRAPVSALDAYEYWKVGFVRLTGEQQQRWVLELQTQCRRKLNDRASQLNDKIL